MKRMLGLTVCAAALLSPAAASAQPERFELGQRLRAFEAAWEKHGGDAAARRRALPPLGDAIKLFFSFKLGEAARALDGARFALADAKAVQPEVAWATSLYLKPTDRLLENDAPLLPFAVQHLYQLKGVAAPAGAALRVELLNAAGKPAWPAQESALAVPNKSAVALGKKPIAEGDYTLKAAVVAGGQVLATTEQTVSFAEKLGERLAALEKAVMNLPAGPGTIESETLRELTGLLRALADRATRETNYPAARLLREAEAVAAALQAKRVYFDATQPGQHWLRVPTAKAGTVARVYVPDAVKANQPVPVVLALHGSGGSENLFFDGYGRGLAAKLCQERGWMLVATRAGVLGPTPPAAADLVDALAARYPVDKKRVFLVGHSMGAGHAVALAQEHPGRWAALAALGGGGALPKPDALKAVPVFVGVGDQDFLLAAAKTLHAGLKKAGSAQALYREYADVEHLAVVQVALPDVFAFFDKAAKK